MKPENDIISISSPTRYVLILALLCIAFLCYPIFTINLEDYWHDELFTYFTSHLSSPYDIWQRLKSDTSPPLYFILLHYFINFTENYPINLRWLSVLWAFIGMFGFYCWVRWSINRSTALLGSVFLAFSPFWLFHSQELRMYTMYPALLWWGGAFLTLLITRPSNTNLWLFSFFNSLSLWTHYHAIFFIAGEYLFLIFVIAMTKRKYLSGFVIRSFLFTLIFSLPLLGLIINQIFNSLGNIGWLKSPHWYEIFTCFLVDYTSYTLPSDAQQSSQSLALAILFYALLIMSLQWQSRKNKSFYSGAEKTSSSQSSMSPVSFFLFITFIPIILMFFLSFSPIKFFLSGRYTILCLAPFLALIAYLILSIKSTLLRILFILWFLTMNIVPTVYSLYEREKPNWQMLTTIIDANVHANDFLVFTPTYWGNGYLYYSQNKSPYYSFDEMILSTTHTPHAIIHLIFNYTVNDPPFFPWATVQYMKEKGNYKILFSDRWYTLIRHDSVDFPQLRVWYFKQHVKEQMIQYHRNISN